jgi:hypothetical protein
MTPASACTRFHILPTGLKQRLMSRVLRFRIRNGIFTLRGRYSEALSQTDESVRSKYCRRGQARLDAGFWILDTGSALKFHPEPRIWMLKEGVARATRSIAPRVALLLFVKSTEYLIYPVSSGQYPASWPLTGPGSFQYP